MIRIQQLKLQIPHSEAQIEKKILKVLKIKKEELLSFEITKRSLDARKKPILFYVYTALVEVKNEASIRKKVKDNNIFFGERKKVYTFVPSGNQALNHRPVIIGTGPAGLFCGYQLAKYGYLPILLERGADVDERIKDVNDFWSGKELKENSNVQFGEGGAGTFSDGKLNTLVHDNSGRNTEVLSIFVKFGAPECILYDSKPHIGTDILTNVVKNMRNEIIRLGGEVHFHSKVTEFRTEMGTNGEERLDALLVENTKTGEITELKSDATVLAIGHSARDTFLSLSRSGFEMQAKSFAVGVRVEHPQSFIDESQYGTGFDETLPAAAYKLTAKTKDGKGVYTFCMCPGGYVVNASSEKGRLAINGMSYSGRDGQNANSAVIVTVTPEDYGMTGALSGMEFQRKLEEAAYQEGKGKIPVQLFKDYCKNQSSRGAEEILPQMKGAYTWANVRNIFPESLAADIEEGIFAFDRKMKGYARGDAILSGVESRTSSPIRIVRDEYCQSKIRGLYPCGEGAGYAGGITSAAMDGLKVSECVMNEWQSFDI